LRRVCRLSLAFALAAAVLPGQAAASPQQDAVRIASLAPEAAQLGSGARAQAVEVVPGQWKVRWDRGATGVLEVDVDVPHKAVLAVWTGDDVDYPMARGYPGWFGGRVNALWVWLPLCVLFLAPFVDPKRPFRLLHLDLLVVLSLSVSLAFFNAGRTALSVPLAYPPLLYLMVRALLELRRRGERNGPLVPYIGTRVLTIGLVLVLMLRALLNVVDVGDRTYVGYGTVGSHVVDVGLAGVAGADRIAHGQQLFTRGGGHLDTYGPLNYLAYVPFEAIWPYHGVWDELPAAHAASLAFDLATVLLLVLVGRRMRPGLAGRELGLALAYAWAACPWTAYVLAANTDDALVAATITAALAAWSIPLLRGALLGAGAAIKFAPAVLLPIGFSGGRRAALLMLLGFAFVVVASTLPFVPDGGLRELYDATLGYQLGARSPFSIWGRWEGIDALQTLAKAVAVAIALGSAFAVWRRPGDLRAVAAAIAATLIAFQIAGNHWIYFYVVWGLPALLVALFAATSSERRAASLVNSRP
jgi:Glycosyltransferase family 87